MRKSKTPRFFVLKQLWSTMVFMVVIVYCGPSHLHAGADTGADFLKIPIGSHAASLSQAYTAVASGAEALNWNPAGMVSLNQNSPGSMSLTHQSLLEENNLNA